LKRADLRLLDRYAAVRKLSPRRLRRKWQASPAPVRQAVRREIAAFLAKYEAMRTEMDAAAAFSGAQP
jgi:hypothetical protein